jgi:hypothetical protein
MRNAHCWRVALDLLLWDILLAFAMWQAAFVFQAAVGRGALSALSEVAISGLAPSIAWVGTRALLGLYPGYELNRVEELSRQTVALFATVIAVLAFASQVGGSLFSRPVFFWWALGLFGVAPVARHFVKANLRPNEP